MSLRLLLAMILLGSARIACFRQLAAPRAHLTIRRAATNVVHVRNTQRKIHINTDQVKSVVHDISSLLGVSDFKVDVWFCSESKIRALNNEWRGKSKGTDVLSFPVCDFEEPGIFLFDPSFEFEKMLGDIVIAPAYVQRQAERDKADFEAGRLDLSEDKGVSRAMATKFDLQSRLDLLLVHSMAHLMGYDHENEKDWLLMTEKEDFIIDNLQAYKKAH
jgi:probable rRNA maturation factor